MPHGFARAASLFNRGIAGAYVNSERDAIELWFWTITPDTPPFRRRQTTWRMTEETARARYGDDAIKVEGSLEVRYTGIGSAGVLYRGFKARE